MDLALLERTLAELGEPAYRGRQVWEWTAHGVAGYDEMTNVPTPLRTKLAGSVPFSTLEVVDEARSRDGTVKALFRTADGHPVEAVLMRYRDGRRSLCVSSQSGCPLTCSFCATGQMRFGRNLTPSEIVDQALHLLRTELAVAGERAPSSGSWGVDGRAGPEGTVRGSTGPESTVRPATSGVGGGGLRPPQSSPARGLTNCVFMGMGEPMLNYENVVAAARLLPDIGITHRRTTISTVGWLPGLRRFVEEVEEPIRLALSLHAPGAELRSELMPVNERYPLGDVLATCRRYFALRHRKVFVEYVMLGGVNDSPAHARDLAALLDPQIFKVNLIPYNPTGMFEGSTREAIAAFKRELDRARIPATVRLTRGRDIAAACGQLAAAPKERQRTATSAG